jgi:FMN phosphatase YigB (HAD superfamily)
MSAAITDRRLQPILDAIAQKAIKVLSVDVFDTLIWRKVPEPKDAFWLLGQDFKAKGMLAHHVSASQFAELRASAERKARAIKEKATGTREITLPDIYSLLPTTIFAKATDTLTVCKAEVALERSLMVADREVGALLANAREAGINVTLVSDTYFAADDLKSFIGAAFDGKPPVYDRLVISNEESKPKWRDLFDQLLAEWGVPASEILHVGDNFDADVMPCRRLGMQHVHYDKWVFSPRVQQYEFPKDEAERRALLGTKGDYGLTGLRSRLYHRVPAIVLPDFALHWRYGACVLGPVFAAFGHWMVQECAANKYTKIFGLMREGRFLNRLVDRAADHAGVTLETEELWLSRRAVMRAAVYPDDLSRLAAFISYAPGLDTDEILGQCGLSRTDLAEMPGVGASFDLMDGDDLMRLCAFIEKNEAIKAKVCAVSRVCRRNLLKALSKQIDLNGAAPFVVMDLGYAATIQVVLERILRREGHTVPLVGLYLALNDGALENMLAGLNEGVDLRGYLGHDGFEPKAARILTSMPYVLEHACMCREGSLLEFNDAGEPVLMDNLRDEKQLVQMELMQDGIIACVDAIHAQLGPGFAAAVMGDDDLRRQIESIIVTSTLYPAREEIAAVGQWRHEAKYDVKDLRQFMDMQVDPTELEHKGMPTLNTLTGQQSYWPSAALTLISPFMAEFYAGGFFQAYKASHLSTGPLLGNFAICPDRGEGFDDALQGATPLNINAFGATEIDVTIKPLGGPSFKRLRFRWPQTSAVMKLVSVELNYAGDHGNQRVELVKPERTNLWAFNGMKHIEGTTMLLMPEGPEAVVDIASTTPPWPHMLKLKVRFKYMKLDALFANRSPT